MDEAAKQPKRAPDDSDDWPEPGPEESAWMEEEVMSTQAGEPAASSSTAQQEPATAASATTDDEPLVPTEEFSTDDEQFRNVRVPGNDSH